MLLPGFIFSLIMAVLLCWHAVKTGREQMWLWIIIMFQPIGGLQDDTFDVGPVRKRTEAGTG